MHKKRGQKCKGNVKKKLRAGEYSEKVITLIFMRVVRKFTRTEVRAGIQNAKSLRMKENYHFWGN